MNSVRRQQQYLDLLLLMHRDAFALGSDRSARRSWWFIVGLMLLVAFFFSLVLFVTSPQALAVDVDQLEDLTGGVVPINVRLRSPDYVPFFPPSFHVRGIRHRDTQSFETLIQQLMNNGVLSEVEAQKALQALYQP